MVSLKNLLSEDPTLLAADQQMLLKAAQGKPRDYLGASSIGDPCSRKLWYGLQGDIPRKPFDVASLKRFSDGFSGEDVVIDRLRKVPGLEIWNRTEDGGQIGGECFGGKFGYHVDGVCLGLIQSPKTYHCLEVKIVNNKKFDKFVKLKTEMDEKLVLAEWDAGYYAQAVCYMDLLELTRHYIIVATPGVRDWASCRTNANPAMAKGLMNKAERIIFAKEAPERLSDDPAYYICRWCDYADTCHAK